VKSKQTKNKITMEKKQTAVEWLAERCGLQALEDVIAEAKAMHKEELEHSYFVGSCDRMNDEGSFEQYYNETYGGNNE
jgi:hypothetical protein